MAPGLAEATVPTPARASYALDQPAGPKLDMHPLDANLAAAKSRSARQSAITAPKPRLAYVIGITRATKHAGISRASAAT